MKNMKKILALVLAVMMLLCSVAVLAEGDSGKYPNIEHDHTITINNTHATQAHTYTAYQVFKGNLDADEDTLSDIAWGAGVNGDALLAALKNDAFANHADFAACTDAKDVAKVLENYKNNSLKLDAFARVVKDNLSETKAGTGALDLTTHKAAITVRGDGYYYIEDSFVATGNEDHDTASKYILNVVRNVEITAKDTILTPDKKILEDNALVEKNDAAIGDIITFVVKLPVPDTSVYKDHFILNMNDTLDTGLTFIGIDSIWIDQDSDGANAKGTGDFEILANTTSSEYGYTLTVTNPKVGDEATTPEFVAPAVTPDTTAAVNYRGGQTFKVVFNNFKKAVESVKATGTNVDLDNITAANYPLIGKNLFIKYTAVLNKDAKLAEESNDNTVHFVYSTNPNHDYHGDEPGDQEPTGKTPESVTKTFTTSLKLVKYGDNDESKKLAGATFKLTGTSVLNHTVNQGEKFVDSNYQLQDGESYETGDKNYWLLKDGQYTDTNPAGANMNTTQYADTSKTYKKVIYTKTVVKAEPDFTETAITDENGLLVFKGLKAGTYTLQETIAPEGYNLDNTVYKLVIGWNETGSTDATGYFTTKDDTTKVGNNYVFVMANDGSEYQIKINNNSGSTLPSTGGMGTTILYIGGSILVILAAVLLITKRRMNAED